MKLEEIVKTVEDAFQNPQYVNAKIRYVKSKEEADVCVSRNHTMSDYIVLGAFALFNSIEGKKSELKVYTQKDLKKETIGVWTGNTSYKEVSVESELFLQMFRPLDIIYDTLYKGYFKTMGVGLFMSTVLMHQFADEEAMPKEFMDELIFENFDDTIAAQQNIFTLMKKMTAASIAGMFQEWNHGNIN
ncbi:MAG TPA: hypothetical protein IAB70_00465 [Candidatus Merdicola faecigallinarum]|uniref:Uncharacterized protein n=1 Tax=Candidatus Merdicola faecigallinarum TaxID=2840862 RepID=A0A9D1M021_9FIRM|nr:hypothetical protein [Candidatus Merdicola faecigallinarum]